KKRRVAKPKPLKIGGSRRGRCIPKPLKSSVIREICRLPADACISTSEAEVMYVNSRFGRFVDANKSPEIDRRPRARAPRKPKPENTAKRNTK
ncbi:hypothetical protein KR067_003124, partial [Drosophila pandora]